MTTIQQLEQARDSLVAMADAESRIPIKYALHSAGLFVAQALTQARRMGNEELLQAQLVVLLAPAVDALARLQMRHPEYEAEIRDIPMALSLLTEGARA